MNFKAKILWLLISIISQSTFAAPSFGPQSSSKNTAWDFDFVEEFDGLQNWVRTEGRIGNTDEASKMPKLLDGSDSAWGYFSMWGDSRVPDQDWIGEFGDNRVWRGTKSVAIDIGETAKGPSRFGLHMGEGYTDFYLFYMVNIPKNQWPTSCIEGSCKAAATGVYSEGSPYTWYSSWKFNTFNMDCPSAMCPDRNTYSDKWMLLTHLKQYNYGSAPGITMHFEGHGDDAQDKWATDGNSNLNSLIGDWFGIEYHVIQLETETIFETWIYDQSGNATKIMDRGVWSTPEQAQGTKWNQFFFGGNNSNTYAWGPTMQSYYYLDDVIIDDKRIGPKYFSLISGSSLPVPPENLSGKILK